MFNGNLLCGGAVFGLIRAVYIIHVIRVQRSDYIMLAELGMHDITLDDMNVFLEVGNAEAIVKAVEANYCVSFVSRLAAKWALDQGLVVEIPVNGIQLRRQIYMIRSEMYHASRAVEAFWSFIHFPTNADLLQIAEQ